MKTQVKQFCSSVAIKIQHPFAKEVGFVDVSRSQVSLQNLLEKITPANIHSETDTEISYESELLVTP